MTSKIYQIFLTYNQKAKQQQQSIHKCQQPQIQIYKINHTKQMGQFFFQMLLFDALQQQKQILQNKQAFIHTKKILLSCLQDKFRTGINFIKHQFGLFIKSKFSRFIQEYQYLKKEINIILLQIENRSFQHIIEQYTKRFLQESHQQQIKFQDNSNILSELSDLLQQNQEQFNPFDMKKHKQYQQSSLTINTTHVDQQTKQKIISDLKKISYPQQQLSLLTQQMGYALPSYQSKTRGRQFEYQCILEFKYKGQKKKISATATVRNKAQGKSFTSIKVLKKLYLSYPQIWQKFKQIKQSKNLLVTKQNTNELLLKKLQQQQDEKANNTQQIQHFIEKSKQREQMIKSIREYLSQIKSYKTQLNYLKNANTKIMDFPKHQKKQNKNIWVVTSTINIMNQTFDITNEGLNAKNVEEQNTKQLLEKIYIKYPEIWLKFKKHKLQKNLIC